jgi:hypothetical protein
MSLSLGFFGTPRIPSGNRESGFLDRIFFGTDALVAARLSQQAPSALASISALYAAIGATAHARNFLVASLGQNKYENNEKQSHKSI